MARSKNDEIMAQSTPEGASHLTKAELAELRKRLEEKRHDLRRKSLAHLATATASQDELSEEMDVANAEAQLGDALELANRESELLRSVEAALGKFADGSYGKSEESGDPIPFGRLQALPWARYTAQEEEVLERELRAHRR
jgi:DnaK suppressor protein